MKEIINKIKIKPEATIKEALKKIDETALAILFVCDQNDSLIGSLTDGDIRRIILKTGDLQSKVVDCFNQNPVFAVEGQDTLEDIKKIMLEKIIEVIPVIDDQKRIVNILNWKDVFKEDAVIYQKIDVPVVVMAGGKGERMGPFTKILPKPLIPIGEVPFIEIILNKFHLYGVKKFYITINYKGEMIKAYFSSTQKNYSIKYICEEEFLGTAGSLKLLPKTIKDTFIVSNCDIIVNIDYCDLLSFHRKHKNMLTIVGSIQHYKIPFGIIHFKEEGKVKEIQEKPELDFTINTGMYVLSKEILSLIPENVRFDMTDLISLLLEKGGNIGVYPVSQKSYIDVGQWEEYKQAIEKLSILG